MKKLTSLVLLVIFLLVGDVSSRDVFDRWRPYPTNSTCTNFLPFYKYGLEQIKIWDISGEKGHGSIFGPTPDPLNPGIGWRFDGTNDYITTPDYNIVGIRQTSLTILVWGKFTNNLTLPSIISNEDFTTFTYSVSIFLSSFDPNVIDVELNDDDGLSYKYYQGSLTSVEPTRFHCIGFTFGGGTLRLYVDGVLDPAPVILNDDVIDVINPGILPAIIGGQRCGIKVCSFLTGVIGEIIIFNRELSSQEVRNYYELTRFKYE